MVKLLNTPFGNYGYVQNLTRNPNLNDVSSHQKPVVRQRDVTNVYHAKYLATTNLTQGSKITRARDPESYMKRGLLHKGQLHEALNLNSQIVLPNISKQSSARPRISGSSNHDNIGLGISARKMTVLPQAGVPTFSRQMRSGGVLSAQEYASNRSEVATLISGSRGDIEESSSSQRRAETGELVRAELDLSDLNLLKSKRLKEVYTTMSQKHRQHRESVIMERLLVAEKIHTKLHDEKLKQQRNLLKTSSTAQRNQLREVRGRHSRRFESRLVQVYADEKISPRLQTGSFSVPREVFGLPEKIPASKFNFKPKSRDFSGKLAMDSYNKAKLNLTDNFNNVWNLALRSSRLNRQQITA